MKNVAILLCTLYFVSYAVVNADEGVLQCISQAGSTLAELPSLFSSNSDELIRKRGCIEACLLQKVGYMNGNSINIGYIVERVNEAINDDETRNKILQSIHQCADNGKLMKTKNYDAISKTRTSILYFMHLITLLRLAANADECMVAQRFLRCNLDGVQQSFQQIMSTLLSKINASNLTFPLFSK
ncbi:unnamed protein product [Xylocopa violacea]|uniref:Uncharacterized protein n=1 Tax=Xylocopa violacea TaxID=135666 RepID=A0ABP1NG88_XYLVO